MDVTHEQAARLGQVIGEIARRIVRADLGAREPLRWMMHGAGAALVGLGMDEADWGVLREAALDAARREKHRGA